MLGHSMNKNNDFSILPSEIIYRASEIMHYLLFKLQNQKLVFLCPRDDSQGI